MRRVRVKGERWYPSQIMAIPDPQIQTRRRMRSQTENLAGGVRELLPGYTIYFPQ